MHKAIFLRGVRQGCVLSPILFNLFIKDIPKILESESVNPFVLPNGKKLSCLMYADDLIMLLQTATGLQKCLNVLSEFCSKWGLSVNLNKTKTMVFQKKNKQANKYTFKYNDEVAETVSHYTYLGIKISGSGNFTKATDVLSNKAKNALAALRKKLPIEKLSLTIVNKLFTSFCLPICTLGAEVWGTSLKDDFDFWDKHNIEKTYLHFCKTFLGVNKKASNIGCRAEMGRFPIKIDIDTKILKYWIHLDSLDNKIVKQAFLMSRTLSESRHKSFHSYNGRPTTEILYPLNFNINNGVKQLKEKYQFVETKMTKL